MIYLNVIMYLSFMYIKKNIHIVLFNFMLIEFQYNNAIRAIKENKNTTKLLFSAINPKNFRAQSVY